MKSKKKKKKNVKKYLQRKMIRKIHMTKFISFICISQQIYYEINVCNRNR